MAGGAGQGQIVDDPKAQAPRQDHSTVATGQVSGGVLEPPQKQKFKRGWKKEEHFWFLLGLNYFGEGNWKSISKLVSTRNATQVQSHAQKYLQRRRKPLAEKRKNSIHDHDPYSPDMRKIALRFAVQLRTEGSDCLPTDDLSMRLSSPENKKHSATQSQAQNQALQQSRRHVFHRVCSPTLNAAQAKVQAQPQHLAVEPPSSQPYPRGLTDLDQDSSGLSEVSSDAPTHPASTGRSTPPNADVAHSNAGVSGAVLPQSIESTGSQAQRVSRTGDWHNAAVEGNQGPLRISQDNHYGFGVREMSPATPRDEWSRLEGYEFPDTAHGSRSSPVYDVPSRSDHAASAASQHASEWHSSRADFSFPDGMGKVCNRIARAVEVGRGSPSYPLDGPPSSAYMCPPQPGFDTRPTSTASQWLRPMLSRSPGRSNPPQLTYDLSRAQKALVDCEMKLGINASEHAPLRSMHGDFAAAQAAFVQQTLTEAEARSLRALSPTPPPHLGVQYLHSSYARPEDSEMAPCHLGYKPQMSPISDACIPVESELHHVTADMPGGEADVASNDSYRLPPASGMVFEHVIDDGQSAATRPDVQIPGRTVGEFVNAAYGSHVLQQHQGPFTNYALFE